LIALPFVYSDLWFIKGPTVLGLKSLRRAQLG